MRSLTKLWLALLLPVFFVACNKDAPTSSTTNNNQQQQSTTDYRVFATLNANGSATKNPSVWDSDIKDFTYSCLRDMYYWNDKVPTNIVPSSFATPEAVLDACQYKQEDHTSYLVKDGASFATSLTTGESTSYGLLLKSDALGNLRVAQVEDGSPAATANLRRGMILTKLNGATMFRQVPTLASLDGYQSIAATFQDTNGIAMDVTLTRATFNRKTVLRRSVLNIGGKKVGYLLYTSFTQSSLDELETVFAYFKAQGITELVLDLRYNGGGGGNVSQRLASLIASQLDGNVFYRQAWNQRYSLFNGEGRFETQANGLQLKRVFVLMTGNTASASELIINGLKPHIQVVTIGSTSYGKNTGFWLQVHEKSNYGVAIVNIVAQNSLGESDYSRGFTPNRPEEDDLTKDFGDTREKCFAAALSYIEKGSFPTLSAKDRTRIQSVESERVIYDDPFMRLALLVTRITKR